MIFTSLFDENSFYETFTTDLINCTKEVIIESPYITTERMNKFFPIFKKLIQKGLKIYIVTRNPKYHSKSMENQAESAIHQCEILGIQVLVCSGNHHRKLAILDRKILWEGSLNILSQTRSREIMRRIEDKKLAFEMFDFLKLWRFI